MKKRFLVLFVCLVYGLVLFSIVFSNSKWQILSESEVEEFISQLDEEDGFSCFQEEGLRSVKIIFGFPSRENPTIIWIARMTKEVEPRKFIRKNFLGFGRFYDDQQPEEKRGDVTERKNESSRISM